MVYLLNTTKIVVFVVLVLFIYIFIIFIKFPESMFTDSLSTQKKGYKTENK